MQGQKSRTPNHRVAKGFGVRKRTDSGPGDYNDKQLRSLNSLKSLNVNYSNQAVSDLLQMGNNFSRGESVPNLKIRPEVFR